MEIEQGSKCKDQCMCLEKCPIDENCHMAELSRVSFNEPIFMKYDQNKAEINMYHLKNLNKHTDVIIDKTEPNDKQGIETTRLNVDRDDNNMGHDLTSVIPDKTRPDELTEPNDKQRTENTRSNVNRHIYQMGKDITCAILDKIRQKPITGKKPDSTKPDNSKNEKETDIKNLKTREKLTQNSQSPEKLQEAEQDNVKRLDNNTTNKETQNGKNKPENKTITKCTCNKPQPDKNSKTIGTQTENNLKQQQQGSDKQTNTDDQPKIEMTKRREHKQTNTTPDKSRKTINATNRNDKKNNELITIISEKMSTNQDGDQGGRDQERDQVFKPGEGGDEIQGPKRARDEQDHEGGGNQAQGQEERGDTSTREGGDGQNREERRSRSLSSDYEGDQIQGLTQISNMLKALKDGMAAAAIHNTCYNQNITARMDQTAEQIKLVLSSQELVLGSLPLTDKAIEKVNYQIRQMHGTIEDDSQKNRAALVEVNEEMKDQARENRRSRDQNKAELARMLESDWIILKKYLDEQIQKIHDLLQTRNYQEGDQIERENEAGNRDDHRAGIIVEKIDKVAERSRRKLQHVLKNTRPRRETLPITRHRNLSMQT